MSALPHVQLPASLTLPQATQVLEGLRRSLREQGQTPGAVVIDGSRLEQLDSAAIAVLLQCRRDAQLQGRELHLLDPPIKLLALMRLYGVADLFVGSPAASFTAA